MVTTSPWVSVDYDRVLPPFLFSGLVDLVGFVVGIDFLRALGIDQAGTVAIGVIGIGRLEAPEV